MAQSAENHCVARPLKKKKKGSHPAAVWGVSIAVIAGAVGTMTWMQKRGMQRTSAVASNAVSRVSTESNTATVRTNAPDLAGFLAAIPARTNAADLMNDGTALLGEGHLREAAACYQRALELKPEDEEAHFNLGVTYARLNQLELAEKHYREALRLYEDYAEAHNNLGNVLTRQKRYAEAVQEFQTAIRLSPEYALAYNNWGRALAEQGNPAEALARFSEAVRLDTNYIEARYNLGQTYLSVGQTNDAIAEFDTVLRLRPDFVPAARALTRLRPSR